MNRLNLVVLAMVALGCTACSGKARVTAPGDDSGYVAFEGDAKGVNAFLDGMNGMITNGKASPDKNTAHWITRTRIEREETKRRTAPSFLDNLFGNGAPVPSSAESASESNEVATQGGSL